MRFDLHAPDTCVRQPASARRQRPALALAAALSLLACLPAATFAEDGDATRDFLKCMELKDPEARLACYDAWLRKSCAWARFVPSVAKETCTPGFERTAGARPRSRVHGSRAGGFCDEFRGRDARLGA